MTEETDGALRRGLRTEPLSVDALDRIRAATEREWRGLTQPAPSPRYWRRYVSVAAVVLLALAGSLSVVLDRSTNSSTAKLGTLEHADYPGVMERRRWARDVLIETGTVLLSGQRIVAGGGARIALPVSGSLRLAAGTTVEFKSESLIQLVDGSLYLDFPAGAYPPIDLIVRTPAGTFTHIGTQFQIAVQDGQTLVRVREGQVLWTSEAGDVLADAGTQLLIDRNGNATRQQIATAGTTWSWAETLAAPFDIEGRPLLQFLRYVARETGRQLDFSDEAAERRAAATLLHGSMPELTALEALSAVMATTTLWFTLTPDSIRIESASDPDQAKK